MVLVLYYQYLATGAVFSREIVSDVSNDEGGVLSVRTLSSVIFFSFCCMQVGMSYGAAETDRDDETSASFDR